MRKSRISLVVVGLWTVVGAWLASACSSDGAVVPESISLESISPSSGPFGTEVTLHGSGFTAEDNDVGVRNQEIEFQGQNVGYLSDLSSPDGRTLRFTLPETLGACAFPQLKPNVPCPAIALPLPAGKSEIFVVNENGESDGVTFTVSDLRNATPEP